MLDLVHELFSDYTLRTVALGSAVLGITSGALGSYAVLRKQSLLGDAISHAALPGIALAYLLTRSKTPLVLVLGAIAAGWIATLAIMNIVRNSRVKFESALGLVLSVFFGFGLVLLTLIQKLPDSTQAGLDKFLFGQAATLMERDVITMGTIGVITLSLMLAFWKEFKLLCFDEEFGTSLGFPMKALDILLTTLLVIAIVLGLQTVGVVLMSAMVVAPAAAARQWTDRMGIMVGTAALFGALSGVSGSIISSSTAHLPTGPTIVLCISAIIVISFFLAPNRGIVWSCVRERSNRKKLQVDAVLSDLYVLAMQHRDIDHGHPVKVLRAMSLGHGGTDRSLKELEERGLAQRVGPATWALTHRGLEEAERLARDQGGNS